MNNQIKVGFLVSYDFIYLKNSIPIVYDHVDYIALAIDINRKTWSGSSFTISDDFFEWIKAIDTKKKIHIYEDDFSIPSLTPFENDTRERIMLSKFMGEGGWHVQIDADEYYVDFVGFLDYLKTLDVSIPTLVRAQFLVMFKQDNDGTYMVISKEILPVATNKPNYDGVRYVSGLNEIYTSFKILHQSWARPAQEIEYKISNWGHRDDFDTKEYFNLWAFLNKFNCKYIKDFHPLTPKTWESLEYIPTTDITKLLQVYKKRDEAELLEKKQTISVKEFIPPIFHGILRRIKRKIKK